MKPTNARPHVVIVGGGISGLAAAFSLRDEPVRVTVLEGSPRLGGKLSVSGIAGVEVDEGAEALLVTRPEGTALIAEAGLGDQRTDPGPTSSAIWTLGALRPLPRRPPGNALPSLWHHPHQTIRRECHNHAVPAT